jgi:threonine/homoserine/homoserine lactone efflux protein
MLGTHSLGVFAATVFVLNATPGVDMMFALTQTLRHGVAAGMAAALGALGGCVVHTLVAAFGLAALLAASATAFTLVKGAGAAYLLWLALGMIRASLAKPVGEIATAADGAAPGVRQGRPGLPRIFGQGVLTNVLNPKIALFFLALLPQFIDAGAADKLLAFLFLGAWFVVQSAVFLAAFVVLVAPLRRWRASPAWRRGLNATGAAIFVWLAARLALVDRS